MKNVWDWFPLWTSKLESEYLLYIPSYPFLPPHPSLPYVGLAAFDAEKVAPKML